MSRGRLVVSAATSLAIAGTAAEVAARALSSRLPAVRLWHDPVAQLKVGQMDARRRAGATGGVVFVGSSQVLEGVLPSMAAPGLGARAYNASLHRGFLPLTERWLPEVVVPRLRPKLVVVGVGVLDLTDNGRAQYEVVDRFEAARARQPGAGAQLARRALAASALLRHGLAPLGASVVHRDLQVGPDGEGLEFAAATEYRLSDKKRAYIEDELLAGYETGPKSLGRLERIIGSVRAARSDVVLVELPHTTELLPMLPRQQADVVRARTEAGSLAARQGVRLVGDLMVMDDHRWFADCIHLNGAGMRHASGLLAAALAPELAFVRAS